MAAVVDWLEVLFSNQFEPQHDKTSKMACASAQSDQSLRCSHEEAFSPLLPIEHTVKMLIRLGGRPG